MNYTLNETTQEIKPRFERGETEDELTLKRQLFAFKALVGSDGWKEMEKQFAVARLQIEDSAKARALAEENGKCAARMNLLNGFDQASALVLTLITKIEDALERKKQEDSDDGSGND